MPKGSLYARKQPILDDEVKASMALGADLIHGPDVHDMERGGYAWLIHDGCKSEEEAIEIKRALKRSAQAISRLKAYPEISVNAWVEKGPFGGWQVKFRATCKECARAWLIKTHGDDPSKWPYNPRAKVQKEK